jgi:hypothetical protein
VIRPPAPDPNEGDAVVGIFADLDGTVIEVRQH